MNRLHWSLVHSVAAVGCLGVFVAADLASHVFNGGITYVIVAAIGALGVTGAVHAAKHKEG